MEERAGPTTNTRLIPSIFGQKNNIFMVLESRGYSIYTFAQLSWHSKGENDFWMVTFGFLLFSSPFPLSAFCSDTCKTELWMVRSWIPSFLIPFSCHSVLLLTCKKKLWMVRSWVPSFLIPVSFQSSLSNRSRNELWMGRYGGRAGRTTNTYKYNLKSEHPFKCSIFSGFYNIFYL